MGNQGQNSEKEIGFDSERHILSSLVLVLLLAQAFTHIYTEGPLEGHFSMCCCWESSEVVKENRSRVFLLQRREKHCFFFSSGAGIASFKNCRNCKCLV